MQFTHITLKDKKTGAIFTVGMVGKMTKKTCRTLAKLINGKILSIRWSE